MNQETKVCQNCHRQFTIEPEDFNFYEKISVPPPTFCPKCRMTRRFVFWNQHLLFRKKEAAEGKEVFSTYPEEAKIKIYDHDYWWSDKWDPLRYGRDYDFSRPFFEQYRELIAEIPWPSRSIRGMVESDYCNQASYLKNCYLCFNCEEAQDCLYAVGFRAAKDCMEIYWSSEIELCYELSFSGHAYQCFFSVECYDSQNVWFSLNCENCSDCFGCVNLRHKKYHIFNEPYSKDEYFQKLKEFNLGSHESLERIKKKVREFWLRFPQKHMHGTHNTNVVGDYIWNSKNVRYVFQGSRLDNVRYSQNLGFDIKDSYDYTNWGQESELIYECASTGDNCRNVKFSFDCWPADQDMEYCMSCHSSSDLFGCFGLKKKQFCILNKEYPEEEYRALREKIIKHMDEMPHVSEVRGQKSEVRKIVYKYGEFFPPEFSPLAYNESIAADYYPINKAEAERGGFLWRDPHAREYEITVPAENLPDHIRDAEENITKEIIACRSCKRAYRILPRELEFYKRFTLPLPRLCPLCRYAERAKFRNPLVWHKRKCMCAGKASDALNSSNVYTNTVPLHQSHTADEHCPNDFETSYAPNRPEIVYCEACYQSEVV